MESFFILSYLAISHAKQARKTAPTTRPFQAPTQRSGRPEIDMHSLKEPLIHVKASVHETHRCIDHNDQPLSLLATYSHLSPLAPTIQKLRSSTIYLVSSIRRWIVWNLLQESKDWRQPYKRKLFCALNDFLQSNDFLWHKFQTIWQALIPHTVSAGQRHSCLCVLAHVANGTWAMGSSS